MKVIGICGGSGSGKTEALKILSGAGIPVLNSDSVSREVMSAGTECTRELCKAFGDDILGADGAPDRKKLFRLTFTDSEKYAVLCEITHTHILARIDDWLGSLSGFAVAVIEAPLLFESGLDSRCDAVIMITSPAEQRINRLCARDNISPEDVRLRLSRQASEKETAERCDMVIVNDGGLEEFREKLLKAVAELTRAL